MIQDNQLIKNFRSLSPEKQAEVVDFIDFLNARQQQAQKNEPHKWVEIAGIAKGLTHGDIQDSISSQRQESERKYR